MYDTLLQLPLFQGLGKNDFTDIIEKVKLHFTNYKEGETIACQGGKNNQLLFLLKGEIMSERKDRQGRYLWYEFFKDPMVIEPYSLFGMYPILTQSYIAATYVDFVSIDKRYILEVLGKYEIFQLNYLNILSNRAQMFQNRLLNAKGNTLKERICQLLLFQAEQPNGRKILKISMEGLAEMLNETRLSVSHSLNELQDSGLILLKRKAIVIEELKKLYNPQYFT